MDDNAQRNQRDDAFNDVNQTVKRKMYLRWAVIATIVIAIAFFLYWLFYSRFYIETDNAYVNGNIVQVTSQTSGTIKNIYADITDYVAIGQPLFSIEQHDANVRLARARANLAETMRQVGQYIETVKKNRAMLAVRKAELENATNVFNRRVNLWKTRNVSQEVWQDARASKEVAESQYQLALHELASSLVFVHNTTMFNHPLVEIAKADFRNAYLDKERTTVYSPVSGYIAKRNAQIGSLALPGVVMYAIVILNEIWVDANFKENQLNRLRIGQPVKLIADKNGREYHGKIVGLYSGTGSVFSLLPAQNASGNWIKITQRLPVRIALDTEEIKKYPLEIGLSMHVVVDARNLNLPVLNKVRRENIPQYSTNIYNNQLKAADVEIQKIYQEQVMSDDLSSSVSTNKEEKLNAQ